MGKYTNTNGVSCFWPDDTDDTLYIACYDAYAMSEILHSIQQHFGFTERLEDYSIAAEYIHTNATGYDHYDPGDYTKFLVITKLPKDERG